MTVHAPSTGSPLPVDALLPDIVRAFERSPAVVIQAPPGAGKTTRVPRALLEAGAARRGEIWVLQPRRLPARLAATRVAEELGEAAGRTVGYTVRFEDVTSPETRIRFVTEGVLTRRLLTDPALRGVGTVLLDEFHERHIATDLALALLRRLQRTARPDLRLGVMSATLDVKPLEEYLGICPVLHSEGRSFEVSVEHLETPDARPLAAQVASAVRTLLREGPAGDILVFLPGAADIRRAREALTGIADAAGALVLPLHGDMPLAEQTRAVSPSSHRKIILSTNVAESSVTVEGVTGVVDTGLARVAAHSPWSGLPALSVAKISQASAIQRAGRAGRVRPGRALRLFTRHDLELRRPFDAPEIARLDLSDTMLALRGLGADPQAFDWFEPPPPAATGAAEELLVRLGAVDGSGGLTPMGRRMLRLPIHPRLARLVCEGADRGVGDRACAAAALISERDIRERARTSFGAVRGEPGANGIDLLDLLDLFEQARAGRFHRDVLRRLGLDARAVATVEHARRQLAAIVGVGASARNAQTDDAVAISALAAFPDRVARRRPTDAAARDRRRTVVLAAGGTAELDFESDADLLVAIDAEERARSGRPSGFTSIRLATRIEPEWLLGVENGPLRETNELAWNPKTERVERRYRMAYGALALDESSGPAPACEAAARLLAEMALAHGADNFDEAGALAALAARVAVVRGALPEAALPALDGDDIRRALTEACASITSFAELRETPLSTRLLHSMPPEAQRLIASAAPETLSLPGGRRVRVHYQADAPPWIESRLQDFFGMRQTPSICAGRVALTLHLLAPNGRAVQVTRDLESFWEQHYPSLRRELGRRYPKHAWPEDGRTATPPAPRRG